MNVTEAATVLTFFTLFQCAQIYYARRDDKKQQKPQAQIQNHTQKEKGKKNSKLEFFIHFHSTDDDVCFPNNSKPACSFTKQMTLRMHSRN